MIVDHIKPIRALLNKGAEMIATHLHQLEKGNGESKEANESPFTRSDRKGQLTAGRKFQEHLLTAQPTVTLKLSNH